MAIAFRAGFVHYATFPDVAEFEKSILAVLDAGFEVVEVSSMLTPKRLAHAAGLVRARGGALFLSAGPEFVRTPRSLSDVRAELREGALARAFELIDLAQDLGAENLMLVSGADQGAARRTAALSLLSESLTRIAERVQARGGPRVTVETFPRDRAPSQLLGPTADAVAALESVSSPQIGVTIDLSHLVQLGEDPSASAAALARFSSHVHLATCVLATGHPLDGDQHPTFHEPGIAFTLSAAASAIRGVQMGGVVSVEMRRHHGESGEAFVRAAARDWQTAVRGTPADPQRGA